MITIEEKVDFRRRSPGQPARKPAVDAPVGRVPRISKLMALAIQFDRLLREGTICGHTDLARLAKVTQPRVTQIMNLLNLAPDIPEELRFVPPGHVWRLSHPPEDAAADRCGDGLGQAAGDVGTSAVESVGLSGGLAGLCSVFKRLTGKGLSG